MPNLIAGQRLKQCRKKANKTLEQIGMICGVHKTTVMRWEKGEIEKIGLPTIQFLADFYNVSTNWILGKDISSYDKAVSSKTKTTDFSKKLREIRIKKNLSQQNLADIIGISKSSINMYERGEREPNFSTLVSLADFFNVDINYLLGYETSFSDIEFCLIESFRKNKDMQAAILKLLDITKL